MVNLNLKVEDQPMFNMGMLIAALIIGAVISFGMRFLPLPMDTPMMRYLATSVAVLVGLIIVKVVR